jgi:2-polyprenyl-3-methyl-5-hydroxy-6-metoxy-1,4-benzoquinol methylase
LKSEAVSYIGDELELFALARNWKAYLARRLQPFLGHRVLEVGSGLGATTAVLCIDDHERWVCLEPDIAMAKQLEESVASERLPQCCEVIAGTVATANVAGPFDTILYVDVLEHIEDDREELAQIPSLLADGGRLVVVAPAHSWLYSPFDARIGHHRRYTRSTLQTVAPANLRQETLEYLDSASLFASMANRVLLRQALPTKRQILFWDRILVPVSRMLDVALAGRFGKSLFGVWRRIAEGNP